MYIRKVEIQNYRCFSTFTVTNLSQITVIIGENESGKSSFFSALSLPLSGSDISFNQKRLKVSDINSQSILAFYKAVIEKKPNSELVELIPKVFVKVEIVDPKNQYEEALLRKWLTIDPSGMVYEIRYDFKPKSDEDLIAAVKELLKDTTSVDEARWFTLPVELFEYGIVSTNNNKQIGFNELKRLSINNISAERDDFSEGNTMKANSLLTRMLVTTLKEPEKAVINNAYTDFFKAIEHTETFKKIIKLDPEFKNFRSHVEDIECIPNIPNLKNILSNITLKTGEEFLYQRGLGERNLIYIIMLFEFYKTDKGYFNLCCIEEPESHLGVNNLRLVTDFIYKSTKTENSLLQTFVSSHNPSVINKLNISNVIVFSGEKAVNLQNSPNDLVDYLRKRPNFDILKLLFADKIILVEGPTEEMLINSFLFKESDALNVIEVISVGQKGFKTFLDIWLRVNKGNISKKIGIIRDFDNQPNAKSEHDKYDAENENICVRTTVKYTLENDLVDAGENLKILAKTFDLGSGATADDVCNHMIDAKTNSMLNLCDALVDEGNPIELELPKHIKEVVEFLK
ncbi:MAG: AAA family ATPase [Candidatus Thiodiazotropha sp. 6PDIVS]